MSGKTTPESDSETPPGLEELLREAGVADDWDVLLVGDGSGNLWANGCGWACVLVDRATMTEKLFYACASAGTNYTAELEAYFRPMLWYSNGPGATLITDRVAEGRKPLVKVHVITDAQILAKQGNGLARRDKNQELWAALSHMSRRGYQYNWHWRPRESSPLNRWADKQSRRMRTALKGLQAVLDSTEADGNPYEEHRAKPAR